MNVIGIKDGKVFVVAQVKDKTRPNASITVPVDMVITDASHKFKEGDVYSLDQWQRYNLSDDDRAFYHAPKVVGLDKFMEALPLANRTALGGLIAEASLYVPADPKPGKPTPVIRIDLLTVKEFFEDRFRTIDANEWVSFINVIVSTRLPAMSILTAINVRAVFIELGKTAPSIN